MSSSKYLAPVPKREKSETGKVSASGKCDACGWDFSKKHEDEVTKTNGDVVKRSVVRDEIRRPIYEGKEIIRIITRCGDCFEREQYVTRKHRYAGCEAVEAVRRSSIRKAMDEPAKVVP